VAESEVPEASDSALNPFGRHVSELDELYSKDNQKVQKMMGQGIEHDFDVVQEWANVCDWFESEDMLRDVNRRGISPTDAEEMLALDPKTTWAQLTPAIRSTCITGLEFYHTDPKQAHTNHHMDLKQKDLLPRQTWLIHFTNEAEDIAQNGFKIGFNDEEKLGLTALFYGNSRHKQGMGFNFAFLPRDADLEQVNVTYGRNAVMFQSSGVYARHYNDRENQVIFAGGEVDPSGIIQLRRDGRKEWSVVSKMPLGKSGRTIVVTRPLKDCIEWVKNNFSRYKRIFAAAPGSYDKQTQKITAGTENPPDPKLPPVDYSNIFKDMFAEAPQLEEITRKPEIGRGTNTTVYNLRTRPDMVAKKMFAGDMGRTMKDYTILKAHPDLFSRVYQISPERGVVVVEKLDVQQSIALGHDIGERLYDFPDSHESHINVLDLLVNNRPQNQYGKYTLTLIEEHFPDVVKRLQFLGDGIRKLFPNRSIDFQFENMGFDKQGNLKFLDI